MPLLAFCQNTCDAYLYRQSTLDTVERSGRAAAPWEKLRARGGIKSDAFNLTASSKATGGTIPCGHQLFRRQRRSPREHDFTSIRTIVWTTNARINNSSNCAKKKLL
uniref:Uncharacterized protein n=1 Tax=Chrysotila carterae TaxID=13221 RepID=A0A7S4C097_CHRCT